MVEVQKTYIFGVCEKHFAGDVRKLIPRLDQHPFKCSLSSNVETEVL